MTMTAPVPLAPMADLSTLPATAACGVGVPG